MSPETPRLEGDALKAVGHRGSHMQIVASAGSGKTEVVSQRIVDLLINDEPPESIVAFTFTERAAESLKHRVEQRVSDRLGDQFLDRLNPCFIGTIHSYCYRLLQEHVPAYETFDILDDNRLAAFLTRESSRLELKSLTGKLFSSIREFIRNIGVVDNELIPYDKLTPPFRDIAVRFDEALTRHRFLTYGRIISHSVLALEDPEVLKAVQAPLRHLIVDEYQDINPAQEELIRRLATLPVELCVVGDDDQSIYQWRGSDVGNIIRFHQRYDPVTSYNLLKNRRSRPTIIKASNAFAETIQGRLKKEMEQHRPTAAPELVSWRADTEADEAALIASTILQLHDTGYRFRDVAVLVRSSTSYEKLLCALAEHDIPVQPGDRTGLFKDPDAQLFGRTVAYLIDHDWRSSPYGRGTPVKLDSLIADYTERFQLDMHRKSQVVDRLAAWKKEVAAPTGPADLIASYYDLLGDCEVAGWDFHEPTSIARLGTLARCSAILADYESIRRRARPDESQPGQQIGGRDRGKDYYKWLAIHIQNWALGAFEGFEGEDDFTLDAVDLTTVHKAKGLEWPIVFVPCVSANRFPSSNTGKEQAWCVPTELFDRRRYEGTENDERRLFYVAMTRARDWLSISTHDTPNKRPVAPSEFIMDVAGRDLRRLDALPLPPPTLAPDANEDTLSISVSELANYRSCGLSYRLRSLIGFQPSLAPELGYGKAVHHIMRSVAEFTRRAHQPPSPDQLDLIFDREFYLPAANAVGHMQMKVAARKLVDRYVDKYSDDLKRVWAIERPFELHLPHATVIGRADVILDEQSNQISSLTIVDYKTTVDTADELDTQLQIYADAGKREGLNVDAAFLHDLKDGERQPVDVSQAALEKTEAEVILLIDRLTAREFDASPGPQCRRCDVRALCRYAE